MNRRRFLTFSSLLCGWGTVPTRWLRAASRPSQPLSFHVAGVRFHKVSAAPKAGDAAIIEARDFRGKPCYAVLTIQGEMLGWVPQSLTPLLVDQRVASAHFSGANIHTLPWRRYEVTASVEDLV
jgi:hypothetical protein